MKKKVVSRDEQLVNLSLKQHELFRRAEQGECKDIEEVICAVQSIIDGASSTHPILSTCGAKPTDEIEETDRDLWLDRQI